MSTRLVQIELKRKKIPKLKLETSVSAKGVNELSEFEQSEQTRTSDSFGIAQKNSNPWNSREKFESWEIVVKIRIQIYFSLLFLRHPCFNDSLNLLCAVTLQ